jgi:hypothetical protein
LTIPLLVLFGGLLAIVFCVTAIQDIDLRGAGWGKCESVGVVVGATCGTLAIFWGFTLLLYTVLRTLA